MRDGGMKVEESQETRGKLGTAGGPREGKSENEIGGARCTQSRCASMVHTRFLRNGGAQIEASTQQGEGDRGDVD
eukprot:870448-Pyramimonas_sp.AAC.1